MPTKNFQTWNDVTQIKSNHNVKDFYHKNLFRKIYTVVIIWLIWVNVFSLLKYQTFADELVEAPVQEQWEVVTDMWSETTSDLSAPVEDDIVRAADVDHTKDIVMEVTVTEPGQVLGIYKYFTNDYTIDWWIDDGVIEASQDQTYLHTYGSVWTYEVRLALAEWVDRWTFGQLGWWSRQWLVPKDIHYATVSDVKIISMPSLADWFGVSATSPWDDFFAYFNYNWLITELPEWSFDTSSITQAWYNFFSAFNYNWAITELPEWSFDTSSITQAWDDFFYSFNYKWAITEVPYWWFRTENIEEHWYSFFEDSNRFWAITCPNSQQLYRLRCLSEEETWVHYKNWYIELTDGDETIYIKDKNQWATKIANTDDNNYSAFYDQDGYNWWSEYYSNEDNVASFWDYYYRWNNVWATWNELWVNWNNCYFYYWAICVVNEADKLAMVSNGFGTWKVGEDDTGWEKDSTKGNPCNADEWEYLPTVSDWQKAMSIWGKTHGQEMYYNDNRSMPSNLATYWSIWLEDISDFYRDLLIPTAGIITTEESYWGWSPVGYDWNGQVYLNALWLETLWTARDGDKIWYIWRWEEWYIGWLRGWMSELIWRNPNEDENVYPYGDDNSVAMPVRCFIDPDYVNPQVLIITLMSDNKVYEELNVVKWNTLAEPAAPSKSNYTFDGWYTEDGEKYNFSTPFTSDLTLYAKWTENKSSWGYSGWGGWSSSKPDKSHGSADDNKETMDTKKDEPKVEEPKKEPEQPSQWKTLDTTSPSKETFNAHQWAYSNGLTKYRTASEARMDDPLNRSEMAKISSIFATQFLDKVPNEKKKEFCSQYPDLWKVTSDMEAFIIESCELGYMWYESNGIDALERFRPYTPVTVAEAATILSRIVWWNDNAMNGKDWYKWHLYATYNHWLIDDIKDPTKRSITRREAYTMLYRLIVKS